MGFKRKWSFKNEDFEKLFKVSRRTLKRWELVGEIDRGDLGSIVDKYIKERGNREKKRI